MFRPRPVRLSRVGASSGSEDPAYAPKAATSGTGDSVTGGAGGGRGRGSEQQKVADIDMSNE